MRSHSDFGRMVGSPLMIASGAPMATAALVPVDYRRSEGWRAQAEAFGASPGLAVRPKVRARVICPHRLWWCRG